MDWIKKRQVEAAEKVWAEMAKPMPEHKHDFGDYRFDPWEIFPAIYGSYAQDFDQCAIDVLTEVATGTKRRDDLGAEMLREMLCVQDLCEYGTSPRVCFPTEPFRAALPRLVRMWIEWSELMWSEDTA